MSFISIITESIKIIKQNQTASEVFEVNKTHDNPQPNFNKSHQINKGLLASNHRVGLKLGSKVNFKDFIVIFGGFTHSGIKQQYEL